MKTVIATNDNIKELVKAAIKEFGQKDIGTKKDK